MMSAVLAIRLLLPERHAEVREERFRVLIGPRRRDDVDVHAADLVDLVVDDLGEDHLLLEPERVVPSAVESLPRHALEVAHARQRDVDEPIEKLVHPRTTDAPSRRPRPAARPRPSPAEPSPRRRVCRSAASALASAHPWP